MPGLFFREPRTNGRTSLFKEVSVFKVSYSATGPPAPGTDFKAPASLKHHRFRHLLEGFRRVLEGVLKGPSKNRSEIPSLKAQRLKKFKILKISSSLL